jgi:hypothetical protein
MVVELAKIDLPEFGLPTVEPQIPASTYEARIAEARRRAANLGCDVLVVYGDREHSANIAYLTNYDPRFEEALLILTPNRKPDLLVGNEGWGYANISKIDHERILYQSFSLLSQPRGSSKSLAQIFQDAGIARGSRVGVVGWKYFDQRETTTPETWLDVPSYIVDTLRGLTGDSKYVFNATHIFMNPDDGLRVINDVDQLAAFEFAATYTSQAVRNVLFGLQPGMTEYDAVRLMGLNGMPLSCHLMLSGGERAAMGLPSPSMRVLQQADPVTVAYGVWGALNARAGFLVHDASELPADIRDYVEKLVAPYFTAIAEWYQHIGIGVRGGDLYSIIEQHIGDAFFGVGLNPGHLIHLDEWVHSPIFKDSKLTLKSGMALQVDVIPATGTRYFTTNIEDGIALADEQLRADFERKYPEAWTRIEARRAFMQDTLGIQLKPEVLPFSNIPAYLPPFWLSPHRAMRMKAI